jgi:hypothetical protein
MDRQPADGPTGIDACLSPIQAFWFTAYRPEHGRHCLFMEKMTNQLIRYPDHLRVAPI